METNSLRDSLVNIGGNLEKLKLMETVLNKVLGHDMPEKEKEEGISLAIMHLYHGLLLAKSEELQEAEEQFMRCVQLLKNKELQSEAVLPVIYALNQLCIIWSQWNQPVKAKDFLDQAAQIYNDFINTNKPCIFSASLLNLIMAVNYDIKQMTGEISSDEVLEQFHTLTLYYLAQVYRKMQDYYQSAIYLHITLRRQLGSDSISQDLDYIDWATDTAQLSLFFMRDHIFPPARHHLAAASYILQKYEDMLKHKTKENGESEALAADWEMFKQASANVAKYWGKYGILLLDFSVERLVEQAEPDKKNDESNNKDSSKPKMVDDLKFDILEKELEPIENQITDKYVEGFDDARLVFLNAQKWLQQAKAYYTLENYASDHILIVQDISTAYKYLSFFEENEDRKAKMHKRRIDILEDVIKELNPQYYESACRQIWMELGGIYCNILCIKLIRLESSKEEPTQQVVTKINSLTKTAIKYLQTYIDSIQIQYSHPNFEMQQIPDELLGPTLLAYYYIGRLYRKIITSDKAILVKNMQNSISAYKFVVDYCDKYPEAAESMAVEQLAMNSVHCKELIYLLPKCNSKEGREAKRSDTALLIPNHKKLKWVLMTLAPQNLKHRKSIHFW